MEKASTFSKVEDGGTKDSAHHAILCSSVANVLSPERNDKETAGLFAGGPGSNSSDAAVQQGTGEQ